MTHIKINELEAISLAAGKSETRYFLCGVYVEIYQDGTHSLVATDGYRLASLRVQPAENVVASYIIGNDDVKKIVSLSKTVKKLEVQARVTLLDKKSLAVDIVIIKEDGTAEKIMTFAVQPVDGNYPDYRLMIPAKPEANGGAYSCFNADFMADFGKMAKILTGSKVARIAMIGAEDTAPLHIEIPDVPEFAGILMQMRK